jgi:hypothetical protein
MLLWKVREFLMGEASRESDSLDQLTNVLPPASDTSSVSLSASHISSVKCSLSSSNELLTVLQAAFDTGLIIVGLLFIALLLPFQLGNDGTKRYQDIMQILATHSLYQPHSWYSIVGPLFSLPLLWIGDKLGYASQWACFYNLLLFASCLFMSFFLLRDYVDCTLLRKFFLVLIYASMFVAHLAFYYGEVFTALCVGFGVLLAARRFTSIAGWIAVILGVVNTPATLLGLGLLVLKRLFDNQRLRYLFVFIAAMLGIVLESWVRRGNFFNSEYVNTRGIRDIMPYSGQVGFSYPLFFGILSLLLSFGDGLLFYTPGLLLPIRKTLSQWPLDQKINLSQVYMLWICFLMGLILVYAKWWDWSGAMFWGPRFLLFASIPASFAVAVRIMRYKEAPLAVNFLTLVIFCLSAWVSIDGAVFQLYIVHIPICTQYHFQLLAVCWYTPEYSPLWQPFVFSHRIDLSQAVFGVFSLLVAVYLIIPLFIHLIKQIWSVTKLYGRKHLNLRLWRF